MSEEEKLDFNLDGLSRTEMRLALKKHMAHKAYWERDHPLHEECVDCVRQLHERMYGTKVVGKAGLPPPILEELKAQEAAKAKQKPE